MVISGSCRLRQPTLRREGNEVTGKRLEAELDALIERAVEFEKQHASELDAVAAEMRPSARNLIHYAAMRQLDLRPLQDDLRNLGLSSLGRMEPCVLATLQTVRRTLGLVTARSQSNIPVPAENALGFDEGGVLLGSRTTRLLGEGRPGRNARIMVTMPTEAAEDAGFVRDLVAAGMDVMRINCAHDDAERWHAMIAHVRAAERETGCRVRVSADLAGPKLRTGPPAETIGIVKLRPTKSLTGEVLEPLLVSLANNASFPLPEELVANLASGDRIEVRDARGRWRRGDVTVGADGPTAQFSKTLYATTGAKVRVRRNGDGVGVDRLGALPLAELPPRLTRGDELRVLRRLEPGPPGRRTIGCTLPQALASVEVGHSIWFDDGRMGGTVTSVDRDGIDVEILHIRGAGAPLRADKGINLPDSPIDLPPLGARDVAALESLAAEVDLVGMSFVRSPEDVLALHAVLDRVGAANVGVELKIENRQAFDHLPQIMLAAMQRGPFAVMVARGDLAVEVGFERLAEVQEEILWLCEAAHVPVVWATQVLEEMAKRGAPSRAEVTDAAMSERAECVMLNKGPYVRDAVVFLDGVLRRMQEHQYKKRSMLRRLRVSELG